MKPSTINDGDPQVDAAYFSAVMCMAIGVAYVVLEFVMSALRG